MVDAACGQLTRLSGVLLGASLARVIDRNRQTLLIDDVAQLATPAERRRRHSACRLNVVAAVVVLAVSVQRCAES